MVIFGVGLDEAAVKALDPAAHLPSLAVIETPQASAAGGLGFNVDDGIGVGAALIFIVAQGGAGAVGLVFLNEAPKAVVVPRGGEAVRTRGGF